MPSETVRNEIQEILRALAEGRLSQEEAGRTLLENDPDYGPGLLVLAASREQAGGLTEAETLSWKALELIPCRYIAYLSLARVFAARDPGDPRVHALQNLALWKLSFLEEISKDTAEVFQQLGFSQLDFNDPETYAMLATTLEGARKDDPEPLEVTGQFLPYRLLNELQQQADRVVSRALVRRICDCAPRCAPIFRAALRDCREHPEFLSIDAVCLIIALLGEISGTEVMEDLLDLLTHADEAIFAHANWAVWRLGRRFPSEVLAHLRSAARQATITPLCAIAEQMNLLPDTPGLAEALIELLDRLPEFADDPDAPHLLATVWYALSELGMEEQADEIMAVYRFKLSATERKNLKRMVETKDGFVPRLLAQGIDGVDIDDVCVDRALMGDGEDEDEEAAEPEERQPGGDPDFAALVRSLMDFAQEWCSRDELKRAFTMFFGEPPQAGQEAPEMDGFVEWYIYDFRARPNGRTAAEEFRKRHGNLSPRRRGLLEALCAARFGLHEVERVEEGSGIELKDLFTGEQCFVHDVASSRQLVRWDCILNRVFQFEGRWEFAGNGFLVPRHLLERFVDRVREGAQAARQSPAEYLRATSHQWGCTVREMLRHQVRDLRVVNAEGDELEFSSATYELTDELRARTALAAAKVFEETTSEKDEPGIHHFGWLETGVEGPRRSYGHIEIRDGTLRLECNSRKRLSIGRQLVEKHAGEFLKHLRDSFESLDQVKANATKAGARPSEPKPLPPEVAHDLILQLKAEHYATWPDIPLPALSGRTPRDAVRSEVDRREVEELLRMMENHEGREDREGRPAFDFAPLRRELGL